MTDIPPEVRALAQHRLGRSRDILDEAHILHQAGHPRGAVDRYYYAMFQAARALLTLKGLDSSKHSGVLSLFNREFVKPGNVARDMGRKLMDAFDLRIESDYSDFRTFTEEEVAELEQSAEAFVQACQQIVDSLPTT